MKLINRLPLPTHVFVLTAIAAAALFFSYACTPKQDTTSTTRGWDLAPEEYADLAEQSLMHMEQFEFDEWGEMLADDVEYYFPDGDEGIRTVLIGKRNVVDWWNDWRLTSGIDSMKFSETVFLPVEAEEVPSYSGLPGVYVVSYFSNMMVYNGKPVSIRMNFTMHFNQDQKIDRYFTYYDRTPIIETVQTNILKPDQEE